MLLALIALDFGERNLTPISDPEKWEPLIAATLWEKQQWVSGELKTLSPQSCSSGLRYASPPFRIYQPWFNRRRCEGGS